MKSHIKPYKEKLEKGICEYMDNMPVSERTSNAITSMLNCWNALDDMERKAECAWTLDDTQAAEWCRSMRNADGSTGGHWAVDQTTPVANSLGVEFTHITPAIWNTAMNMMYSDYGTVAAYFGVSTTDFYGEMAKAFLFDKDGPGPKEKMAAYYHCIAKSKKM